MKKLLKAILQELYYIRKCQLAQIDAQGITPPPEEPPPPDPDDN